MNKIIKCSIVLLLAGCATPQSKYISSSGANNLNTNALNNNDMAIAAEYTINSLLESGTLKRKDGELKNKNEFTFDFPVDELDWPTYNTSMIELLHRKFNNLDNRFSRIIFKLMKKSAVFGVFFLRNEEDYANIGVDFLSKYNFVITEILTDLES